MNDASSRSHSLVQIHLKHSAPSDILTSPAVSCITLVDLAGSEMNDDSMHHNSERRNESKAIMASLLALKECIRAKVLFNKAISKEEEESKGDEETDGKKGFFNFRKSKLTMALKGPLTNKNGRYDTYVYVCIEVILFVYFSPQDVLHSYHITCLKRY